MQEILKKFEKYVTKWGLTDIYAYDSCFERLEVLEDVFNERYYQEIIPKGSESTLSEENMNAYADSLHQCISRFIQNNLLQFSVKITDGEQPLVQQDDCILFLCGYQIR